MNAGLRLSSILACIALVFTCIGCDGVGTAVSDVPCVRASVWPSNLLMPLVRAAGHGSDVLLVTGQTSDQSVADSEDGPFDFQPHSAVYRFDPEVGSFELVSDATWDDADSRVVICSGPRRQSPFRAARFLSPRLEYNGSMVAVAGGNALLVRASPTQAVAAVLSSAGHSPGGPFAGFSFGTGQHYHQLFSDIDGSPIGDPVRLGVGDDLVEGCWTPQEDFVVYWQFEGNLEGGAITLCAVPVTEDLPPLEGE